MAAVWEGGRGVSRVRALLHWMGGVIGGVGKNEMVTVGDPPWKEARDEARRSCRGVCRVT